MFELGLGGQSAATLEGIAQEIIWFTEHGKPIWYLNLEDLQLKQGN
jgi:hypothetical protein